MIRMRNPILHNCQTVYQRSCLAPCYGDVFHAPGARLSSFASTNGAGEIRTREPSYPGYGISSAAPSTRLGDRSAPLILSAGSRARSSRRPGKKAGSVTWRRSLRQRRLELRGPDPCAKLGSYVGQEGG